MMNSKFVTMLKEADAPVASDDGATDGQDTPESSTGTFDLDGDIYPGQSMDSVSELLSKPVILTINSEGGYDLDLTTNGFPQIMNAIKKSTTPDWQLLDFVK